MPVHRRPTKVEVQCRPIAKLHQGYGVIDILIIRKFGMSNIMPDSEDTSDRLQWVGEGGGIGGVEHPSAEVYVMDTYDVDVSSIRYLRSLARTAVDPDPSGLLRIFDEEA